MKKIACVLVLACVVMAGAFAQQKPAAAPAPAAPAASGGGSSAKVFKNSIGMDVVPLIDGIIAWEDDDWGTHTLICLSFSYERLIVPHFSIGGNLATYFGKFKFDSSYLKDKDYAYFCMAAEGRYYPMANFDKLFFGSAFGFNVFSYDGKTKEKDGGFAGLYFALKTGYKVQTSKGFYMEPSLSYTLSENSTLWDPNGWDVGLRLGFSF